MNVEKIKQIIINSFHEKKNSHAFLLSTNNVELCLSDIKDIIKAVNDWNINDNKNLCLSVDNETLPDLLVVRPEGKEIKRDSVLNVINLFSTTPNISKYSIYIICYAEKLNMSSANKMLKFLEEPEGNIVGFFITENINAIIPTIKSRCEIYNYDFACNSILKMLDITEEQYANMFDTALSFTQRLNDEPKYSLMADTKTLSKREREDIDLFFSLVKKFYILKYENIQLCLYNDLDYLKNILDAIATNDVSVIVNRIKMLDNILNELSIYVNRELIINKFFILWE